MKKFIGLTLKELSSLAYRDGASGLEVSRIDICGIPMYCDGEFTGGMIRYSMRDKADKNSNKRENEDYPLYFYSNRLDDLKWLVDAGAILYPYAGLPIKIIKEKE